MPTWSIFAGPVTNIIHWNWCFITNSSTVLNNLWNISKQEAEDTVDVLWAYDLVQFTDITISPNNIKQNCVEVHAVISQYIIERMDSKEINTLSPYGRLGTSSSVTDGLLLTFQQSYGVHDPSSLTAMGYLKYRLSEIENVVLPDYLKIINMYTVNDPHVVILILQEIKDVFNGLNVHYKSVVIIRINSLIMNGFWKTVPNHTFLFQYIYHCHMNTIAFLII